jgi:hypothetical protein
VRVSSMNFVRTLDISLISLEKEAEN